MPVYPDPKPKTAVGEAFLKQLTKLKDYADRDDKGIKNEEAPFWYMPEDFDPEDLFDFLEMHSPFSREEFEQWFVDVVKDPSDAGTTTDLGVLSLQGDLLHAMERAFRCRHHTAVRNRVHPSGRRWGHSHEHGAIKGGLLAYIQNLDKLQKGEYT